MSGPQEAAAAGSDQDAGPEVAAQESGLKAAMHGSAYEDIEGLAVSVGVMFALLLPSAMALQNIGFDEGVQTKNLLLLLCTEKPFRNFIVETLDAESFKYSFPVGGGSFMNTRDVLTSADMWKWDDGSPEALYPCGQVKEIAATARFLQEHWPQWRTDTWALSHPGAALWSDHLSGMTSFAMSILIAGLCGSLMIYISLSLSPSREDTKGQAVRRWSSIGFPLLFANLVVLIGGIVVILFANDAYSESQDPFFLRSGRWGAYPKIALLAVFAPIVIVFVVGAIASFVMSSRVPPGASPIDEAKEHTHAVSL